MGWTPEARRAAAAARKAKRSMAKSIKVTSFYDRSRLMHMQVGDKMHSPGATVERVEHPQGPWRVTSKLPPASLYGGMVLSRPKDVDLAVKGHDATARRQSGEMSPGARRGVSLIKKIQEFDRGEGDQDVEKMQRRTFAMQKLNDVDLMTAIDHVFGTGSDAHERMVGHLDSRNHTLGNRINRLYGTEPTFR